MSKITRTLQYTPLGATGTVQAVHGVDLPEEAQQVGRVLIPTGHNTTDAISIPFDGITAAKGVLIQNVNNQDAVLTINGHAGTFSIAPGGYVKMACPTDPVTGRLASISFKVPVTQVGNGYINSYVFGG